MAWTDSLAAFICSMLAIAWSAFRYPLTTTTIDLSTGKILKKDKIALDRKSPS